MPLFSFHRCTVVGNPGGVLGVFWEILLRGVLGVVRKLEGGSFLLHFYVEVFQNLFRGYMRCPPSTPLCASMFPFYPFLSVSLIAVLYRTFCSCFCFFLCNYHFILFIYLSLFLILIFSVAIIPVITFLNSYLRAHRSSEQGGS